MSLYLRAAVGGYGLLVPADRVFKVWQHAAAGTPAATAQTEGDGDAESGEPAVAWRDRTLRLVDARPLLGAADAAGGVDLAYGATPDDPDALVLVLDRVDGIESLDAEAFAPLPPAAPEALCLFDAVTRRCWDGLHLYRLRPLPDFAALAAPREDAKIARQEGDGGGG